MFGSIIDRSHDQGSTIMYDQSIVQLFAVMVRTHFARYGKVLSELASNGSETSGSENSPDGERGWRCGSPHCFSACTRKARGGPIQTIAPVFDGLKVFPSLEGFV
jgi:hypothetical protein